MKLNHECVRHILLTVEESDNNEVLSLHFLSQKPNLHIYLESEILYTIQKLVEAGYIQATVKSTPEIQHAVISSITWNGHQFLDNIRETSIWEATKIRAAKLGSVSLPILSELAKSYITEKLGLN
ncbi:DUF2513 domain-containing protein [Bacillus tropicus]|uniref:DUF2513 domain-containing protein n=1 Tax=Bacillus thuringiensis serovar kumamotoensis TaxID=132267 RepID=A0A9X6JHR0_BACUK|nr:MULTISPECIES: DUF2513 domain-containing protein [Bacillus cereus group]MEC2554832.1 DUF2513 domain-containing protein [Bacillus tropicus]MEC2869296.1 DUF2513 domain-containing protein [Bacillus cereus]OTZ65787.1 hypothetical protein BK769_34395 [Bacillus thuringiensis serovar kumamtoensis]